MLNISMNYTTLLPNFHQIYLLDSNLSSCMENSVDPDQLVFQKPADLGQHCFLDISMFSILRVKFAGKNKILPVNSTITDQLKELRIQDTFRGELFLPRQDESKTRNDLTLRELHHKYPPSPDHTHSKQDQIRSGFLSVLIWIQTVSKGYQQRTLVGNQ